MKKSLSLLISFVFGLSTLPVFAAESPRVPEPPPQFIIVGNGVRSPGSYAYFPNVTIKSAVQTGGGFSEFARSRIYLIRDGKSIAMVDYKEINRNPEKDLPLKPWDIVYVAQ